MSLAPRALITGLALVSRRQNYFGEYEYKNDRGIYVKDKQFFDYTTGAISTHQKFVHGYLEIRMRMPDEIDASLWGYTNFACWMMDANEDLDISYQEIDLYENVCHDAVPEHAGGPPNHSVWAMNTHLEKPPGKGDDESWPSHFKHVRVDPAGGTNYGWRYERIFPHFDNGDWHTFSFEWEPDQLKYYYDGKLHFRLEGDYTYTFYDPILGTTRSIRPIHELLAPMPIIVNNHNSGTQTGLHNNTLKHDIDYIRFYKLTKPINCATMDFIKTGTYDFCTQFTLPDYILYDDIILGQNGSTTADVSFSLNCRVTLRGKTIRFEDGFNTGESGEIYAHDVDCSLIK